MPSRSLALIGGVFDSFGMFTSYILWGNIVLCSNGCTD